MEDEGRTALTDFDEDAYAAYMHGLIVEICDRIGPREAGSTAEHRARDRLADEFGTYTDPERVTVEPFTVCNRAYFWWIRICVLLSLVAFALLVAELIWPALIGWAAPIATGLMIGALIVMYFEFLSNRELLEHTRLWPARESANVIAEVGAPPSAAKRTLVFAGHYDSAFILRFIQNWPRYMGRFVGLGIGGMVAILIRAMVETVLQLLAVSGVVAFGPLAGLAPTTWMLIGTLAVLPLVPFVVLNWFQIKYDPVPGASDNLSGTVLLAGLLRLIAETDTAERLDAAGIAVRVIAFGAEEAGIRGSKRYTARHHDELHAEHAELVNLESFTRPDVMVLFTNEAVTRVRYTPALNDALDAAAATIGVRFDREPLRIGQTDAASFIRHGLPATTIMGTVQDPTPDHYHATRDTPAIVVPETLSRVLSIIAHYIEDALD